MMGIRRGYWEMLSDTQVKVLPKQIREWRVETKKRYRQHEEVGTHVNYSNTTRTGVDPNLQGYAGEEVLKILLRLNIHLPQDLARASLPDFIVDFDNGKVQEQRTLDVKTQYITLKNPKEAKLNVSVYVHNKQPLTEKKKYDMYVLMNWDPKTDIITYMGYVNWITIENHGFLNRDKNDETNVWWSLSGDWLSKDLFWELPWCKGVQQL